MQAQVKAFFDPATWTVSYVVFDAPGGHCALVDSVLDYDPKSGRTRTDSADQLIAFVREQNLTVDWILETHAHADHLSAAPYLRKHLGGKIAIGGKITQVQNVFKGIFHLEPEFATNGSQFDHLFEDGDTFAIGTLQAQALSVPGHEHRITHLVGHAGRGVAGHRQRSSCPMWALRAATSPAATPIRCTSRFASC